jgi:type II secretory pathway component GspD/PulD (secretin)
MRSRARPGAGGDLAYQGDKRVSSMPYVLVVNANAQAAIELNMGAEVPIPSTAFVPAAGDTKAQPALRSFTYRNIGTNIVSRASSAEDGRFELTINIDESSVYTKEDGPGASSVGDMPVFRSFKSRNMLLLRDGQTRQYTAATDRASGETLKIDVTLKVVK